MFARPRLLTSVLFFGSFTIYALTVCPEVSFTDNGELAAVAATLGIAHPTGYPLITLLARTVLLLPLGISAIYQLNLFAALISAAAVAMFFQVLMIASRSPIFTRRRKDREERTILPQFIGAGLFAFFTTVWNQAVVFEVYGLQILLTLLILYGFLRGLNDQAEEPNEISRWLIVCAFAIGLGFANHMMTVLIIPGFLYLYLSVLGWSAAARKRLLMLIPWTLAGLSVYLYLMVRSSAEPLLDWGQPATFDRFIRHISGSQYRVWMFSGSEVTKKQFAYFINHVPSEIHPILIPLLLGGMVATFQRSSRQFIFMLALAVTTVGYAVNYDIFDVDSYFLLAFVIFAWWITTAIEWIAARFKASRSREYILAGLAVILFIMLVHSHMSLVDQSSNTLVRDVVQNVDDAVEQGGMLVTAQWDYTIAPLWYSQIVEEKRRDIVVIDHNLMMNRPWYFSQLERTWPGIFDDVRVERDLFLEQLLRFERGMAFDPAVIQSRWNVFWQSFLASASTKRAVYADSRIINQLPKFLIVEPSGLFVRISNTPIPFALKRIPVYHPLDKDDVLTRDLKQFYVGGAVQYGLFLRSRGNEAEARSWFAFGRVVDPSNPYLRMAGILPNP